MKRTFFAVGVVLALGSPAVRSAPPPNFSGTWVLATATASGGRSTTAGAVPRAAEERPTSSHTAFGAAFNCGRECTIVHEAQTLKIEKAFLADRTEAAPTVTLQLNGRHLSPVLGGSVTVTATWTAERLEIVTESAPVGYSQTLWIDGTQLAVVTSDVHGMSRVTLRYNKK
jgi:hypothetical protein